jgi:hypothetical protein
MELGIIQGIRINSEGQSLETIWFAQERESIRDANYKQLKKRDFKVSDVSIKAGFKIPEPKRFDSDLKELLLITAPKLLQ